MKKEIIKEEVLELKQQTGKNILVGSPSLIVALTQLDLIDEYQLVLQPIVLGRGLLLFKKVKDRVNLKLLKQNIWLWSLLWAGKKDRIVGSKAIPLKFTFLTNDKFYTNSNC